MNNWRILPLHVADQQVHIEKSEQLMNSVQPGDPAILYWNMAKPTGLVLGFSQKPDTLNPALTSSVPIYRRRAGGTAVLVGPSLLSLDVILPAGHPLISHDIVESYYWFGAAWVEALKQVGVEAEAIAPCDAHAARERLKDPDPAISSYEQLLNRSCYGTLSPYEVVIGERKVVGLCMVRRKAATLLQAGVLLKWESALVADLLGHTPEEQDLLREGLPRRAVGLDTLLGQPVTAQEIIRAFENVIYSDTISAPTPACSRKSADIT